MQETKLTQEPSTGAEKPQEKTYVYDRQQTAYFLTLNNPKDYGYDAEKIKDIIHAKFKHVVYWAMCDEMGTTYHTHVYILLAKKKRWSAVANAFPHAHIEKSVKGSPEQCRNYIRKEGNFSKEKKETNFPETFYEEGKIPEYFISANKTEMLLQIGQMIESGLRPSEILDKSIIFYQYENIIRKKYFDKRLNETPPLRDIEVVWHLGASGSGKSYTYTKLCEEHGIDDVFYANDYTNNCSAFLDNYEGERYLFIDEVKGDSFKYSYILLLLEGYRRPLHARYSNIFSLWTRVDLTSIFSPIDVYNSMVNPSDRTKDSFQQLARRITKYVYHWKTDDGQYHSYEIPASEFTTYDDLIRKVHADPDGFIPLEENK